MSDVVVVKQPIVVKEPDRISVIAVAAQGPAGTGSGTLDGLSDVDTTGVVNGNALVFDQTTGTWVPGAVSGSYAFTQPTVASTWVITHNLAFFPNVLTVDTAGHEVEGDVRYDSVNQVTVIFGQPVAGAAYLS